MYMHQITANENKAKSIPKYATTNTKDMKVEKPKVQIKNYDQKEKGKKKITLSFLCMLCSWARVSL